MKKGEKVAYAKLKLKDFNLAYVTFSPFFIFDIFHILLVKQV